MNILSLFDGISSGLLALKNLKIPVNAYFSCEIDKYALQISHKNHPEIAKFRLGDVTTLNVNDLPPIYLLMGGSPCHSFSFVGKRDGLTTQHSEEITTLERYLELKHSGFKFQGESFLFWEYVRVLRELKPEYFLLENVFMASKWKKLFDKVLGVEGITINASSFSAQNRKRIYWSNIPGLISRKSLSKDIIADILQIERHHWLEGEFTPVNKRTSSSGIIGLGGLLTPTQNPWQPLTNNVKLSNFRQEQRVYSIYGKCPCIITKNKPIFQINDRFRRLTPNEVELIQGLPINYTKGVSNNQRYIMIGNGWSIPVIEYIFQNLKEDNDFT